MISLFPSGEPLRVSIKSSWTGSHNGALLGFAVGKGDILYGIVVLEDGRVARVQADEFHVDWVYEVENDRWIDVNARRALESDQEG